MDTLYGQVTSRFKKLDIFTLNMEITWRISFIPLRKMLIGKLNIQTTGAKSVLSSSNWDLRQPPITKQIISQPTKICKVILFSPSGKVGPRPERTDGERERHCLGRKCTWRKPWKPLCSRAALLSAIKILIWTGRFTWPWSGNVLGLWVGDINEIYRENHNYVLES